MATHSATANKGHRRPRATATPLAVRLDPISRELIQRAAALEGMPVSQFARQHLLAAAQRTVAEREVLTLSLEAATRFAEMLAAEAEPPAPLVALFARYNDIPFSVPEESA